MENCQERKFVDGQRVAAAGLLEGEQAAAYCGNDFRPYGE